MYVHLPSTKQDVVPLYEEHPQDGFLKVIFRKLLWKIFPPIDVEVYSKKLESWVTMKIPEGLDSLIPMQLAALEARTKLPQFSGIDERNQFLRSYKDEPCIGSGRIAEMIHALRNDYNSLEALLCVHIPIFNDPIPAEGIKVEDYYYGRIFAAAELDLFNRFGGDSEVGKVCKWIRDEAFERRYAREYYRSKGVCCMKSSVAKLLRAETNDSCCEKDVPDEWERAQTAKLWGG